VSRDKPDLKKINSKGIRKGINIYTLKGRTDARSSN